MTTHHHHGGALTRPPPFVVVAPTTQKARRPRGARKGGGTRNNNAASSSSSSSKISLSSSTLAFALGRQRRPEKQRRPPLVRVALEKVAEEGALVSSTSSSSARRRGNHHHHHHHHHHQCRRVFPSSREERVTSSSSLAFGTTSTRTRTETAKNEEPRTTAIEQQRLPGRTATTKRRSGNDDFRERGRRGFGRRRRSDGFVLSRTRLFARAHRDTERLPERDWVFRDENMGFLHQQLIEILAYALCLTGNHIFTSGATGTNAAVIRGSLRAERPELLTVVLPQSDFEATGGIERVVREGESSGGVSG